jgi:DNA-binding response OmpR family regulator
MSKKILVIDEDEDLLKVIFITLKTQGFEVIPSRNFNVLSTLESINPDLILMDNVVNGVRAVEFCKNIKGNAAFSHIPIVLLSAINDLEEFANECGANAYLAKPLDLFEVETLVQELTQ